MRELLPPVSILFLGDSVDRYVTIDTCGARTPLIPWSRGQFKYRTGLGPGAAMLCNTATNDSLAYLNLYGSAPHGPYHHGFKNTAADPYADTPARVCAGLGTYQRHYGAPIAVVFNTILWDIAVEDVRIPLDVFRKQVTERVRDVLRCKNDSSKLFLRTAPSRHWWEQTLLAAGHTFVPTPAHNLSHPEQPARIAAANEFMRQLSSQLGLGLLDFDAWANAGQVVAPLDFTKACCTLDNRLHERAVNNFFRDGFHPGPVLGAGLGWFALATVANSTFAIEGEPEIVHDV
jgi:hypothetical protein